MRRARRRGASASRRSSPAARTARCRTPSRARRSIEPGARSSTIDWGAQLDGYCSDCTRTFAAGGEPGEEERAVYALVLEAQEAALAAVRPGPPGREVDAVAREIIDAAGHGEHFGHGLGHGVGLEIHEGPRLSRLGETALAAGMVVTVEPGVYVPGALRRADRGPGRRHRRRPRGPQHAAEGPPGRRLSTVSVDPRFEGPPGMANGGVVCGLLADRLPPRRPIAVTLRRPVPLATALTIEDDGAGAMVLSGDGEPLAIAHVTDDPVVGPVPDVAPAAARAAVPDPALVAAAPVPRLLRLRPRQGRRGGRRAAARAGRRRRRPARPRGSPGPGLPQDAAGTLAATAVWAALDCPSGAAAVPPGSPPHVLGRIEGRVDGPVRIGEEVLVIAWPLGHEGRKRWGACALRSPDGRVLGVARATWIALA